MKTAPHKLHEVSIKKAYECCFGDPLYNLRCAAAGVDFGVCAPRDCAKSDSRD